jgi:toxin ParE1/3/4
VKPRIHTTPRARRDLEAIATHIARDNVAAGLRFIDAAEAAFAQLARNPETGAPREFDNPRLGSIRMWPVRGFERCLIFYRPIDRGIEIVRVLHASRNVGEIMRRISRY